MIPLNDDAAIIQELLQTPQLLEEAAGSGEPELSLQSRLRALYPAPLVRAAISLRELRDKGRAKFLRADRMWFDRKGLEQATSEAVAVHKAQRFQGVGDVVYDLCCGIGSDSIAIARAGCNVLGVDRSSVACLRTELNAQVYEVGDRVETKIADVVSLEIPQTLVHIDPDRRTGRQRAIKLDDYEPSLEFLQELIEKTPGGAIKVSPASNFGGKFPGCEIELISLRGECKEAVIWFGSLAGSSLPRATILPQGYTLSADPSQHRPRVGQLGRYLYDPDPAIVRAGLVDALADELGLQRLDDAEEYLTSDALVSSPAVAAFEVIEEIGKSPKELRQYFRTEAAGSLEIKSRHVPTDVEALRRQLPLSGKTPRVVVIARLQGRTRAVICKRCETNDG